MVTAAVTSSSLSSSWWLWSHRRHGTFALHHHCCHFAVVVSLRSSSCHRNCLCRLAVVVAVAVPVAITLPGLPSSSRCRGRHHPRCSWCAPSLCWQGAPTSSSSSAAHTARSTLAECLPPSLGLLAVLESATPHCHCCRFRCHHLVVIIVLVVLHLALAGWVGGAGWGQGPRVVRGWVIVIASASMGAGGGVKGVDVPASAPPLQQMGGVKWGRGKGGRTKLPKSSLWDPR
jgi:hypothetical protein